MPSTLVSVQIETIPNETDEKTAWKISEAALRGRIGSRKNYISHSVEYFDK